MTRNEWIWRFAVLLLPFANRASAGHNLSVLPRVGDREMNLLTRQSKDASLRLLEVLKTLTRGEPTWIEEYLAAESELSRADSGPLARTGFELEARTRAVLALVTKGNLTNKKTK